MEFKNRKCGTQSTKHDFDINPNMSVILLNENKLNFLFLKIIRIFKHNAVVIQLQEKYLKHKNVEDLREKAQKKIENNAA